MNGKVYICVYPYYLGNKLPTTNEGNKMALSKSKQVKRTIGGLFLLNDGLIEFVSDDGKTYASKNFNDIMTHIHRECMGLN